MATRLGLATMAVTAPMGQQVYERHVTTGAPHVLGPAFDVRDVVVAPMRGHLPATDRMPARFFHGGPAGVRGLLGRALYRGCDVVHRFDLRLPPAPGPEILTVHDAVWTRFDDEASPPDDAGASARRAAAVICPSSFAAADVADRLGVEAPVAIPNGVDGRFFDASPLEPALLAALGVRPPFVLHAGGCTARKNLAALAGAWGRLAPARPDISLVLLGPEDPRRNLLFDPLPRTVRLGRVDDATALGLLAAASAVVVPSRYEGFGLPALEGMAVGVPVVAAATSSLPEVCGDGATLVEPEADDVAEGLVAVLAGGAAVDAQVARGRERARRFTWEASLAAHAEVWRSVAG